MSKENAMRSKEKTQVYGEKQRKTYRFFTSPQKIIGALLLFGILFTSCSGDTADKQREQYGTTEQDLYEFMEVAFEKLQLTHGHGLKVAPQTECTIWETDSAMFARLTRDPDSPDPLHHSPRADLPKFLEPGDLEFMLQQKKRLDTFHWDVEKLGLNAANDRDWYAFSLPLFSKDRKRVVLTVREMCQIKVCGSRNYLFIHNDGEWTVVKGKKWYH